MRFWWRQQKGRGCGEAHSAEAGGAAPSCPRSQRAEAAAPEMAVAEAAKCRMAAAGTSSPRQVVRAEPASGTVRRPCAEDGPPPELPPSPSAKPALRQAGVRPSADPSLSAQVSFRAKPLRQTQRNCACATARRRAAPPAVHPGAGGAAPAGKGRQGWGRAGAAGPAYGSCARRAGTAGRGQTAIKAARL